MSNLAQIKYSLQVVVFSICQFIYMGLYIAFNYSQSGSEPAALAI